MNWMYEDGRIYYNNEKEELMAEVTYQYLEEGKVNIDHVYVNPVLRGQGIANQAMEKVAVYLRDNGLKAKATCSYAHPWLEKNRKIYEDVIASDFDN